MSLNLYQKKRHFNKTKEPQGEINKFHEPFFAVQKHAAPISIMIFD
jgi:hypothetical protein